MKNIFDGCWETECEELFQSHAADKVRAYICSPLRADSVKETRANMQRAKAYMLYAHEATGIYAYAPHAYLPVLISDENPSQRKLALQFGKTMLTFSDAVYVCGERISEGMKGEIIYAAKLGKKIIVFNAKVFAEARYILMTENICPATLDLQLGYSPLGSDNPITEYVRKLYCGGDSAKGRHNGLSI